MNETKKHIVSINKLKPYVHDSVSCSYVHQHSSISLCVPSRECSHRFVIERRMVIEALKGTESGAGQSTKNDCGVRTVATRW